MYTALVILHLIVCAFLIFIVLIQSSKGAELGAAFGGSNQTLFGSRGAATFLNKLTTGTAIAFMLTSLFLAVMASKRGSIMPEKKSVTEMPSKTPAAPAPQPAGTAQSPANTAEQQPVQPAK